MVAKCKTLGGNYRCTRIMQITSVKNKILRFNPLNMQSQNMVYEISSMPTFRELRCRRAKRRAYVEH